MLRADGNKGGTGSDPTGERLRQILRELGTTDGELRHETRELIRSHLAEDQDAVRDLQERLRAAHEEGEIQSRRRAEVEKMLARRDAAYEELLGESGISLCGLS